MTTERKQRPNDSTSYNIPEDQREAFFSDTNMKKVEGFFCTECGEPEFEEIKDPHRRGCKHCGYITQYPDHHFEDAAAHEERERAKAAA